MPPMWRRLLTPLDGASIMPKTWALGDTVVVSGNPDPAHIFDRVY